MIVRLGLWSAFAGLTLGCAAASDSATTADDLETVAPLSLDWAACWTRAAAAGSAHEVVCSTQALPSEWYAPQLELSARLGSEGPYVALSASETVVGTLSEAQFPARLVVLVRTYGSLLSQTQELESPSTYVADAPFVIAAPFPYWPVTLEASDEAITSIAFDYRAASAPYTVYDQALGQEVDSLRVASGIGLGASGTNRQKLLLPAPSSELALGVNRAAPLTIDGPGRYVFEAGALRPAVDSDVCGIDGAKACRYPDDPCQPTLVEEAGVCRVCGREGGRACAPDSTCDAGLRPDLETDICEPCGKEGLPACGAIWEDRTCEEGLRAVFGADDVECVR